jgi:subtilisin-like proprotein convertase family protein
MRVFTKITLVFLQLFIFSFLKAQNNFWSDVQETTLRSSTKKRLIVPEKGRTLTLDKSQLRSFLNGAPKEFSLNARSKQAILSIPMPSGGFQNFSIVESSMMEPGLAAILSDVKTYSGQGIDDPNATIKLDISSAAFHAMILSPKDGAVFIDPYNRGLDNGYISYFKSDFKSSKKLVERVTSVAGDKRDIVINQFRTEAGVCIGGTLKSYRLAVACTGEYSQALGANTPTAALNAIVTTVNRVNGIYEKELDIRLILVANNLKVVFTDPATDKFTGNDDEEMLVEESQQVITDSIGSANYDIGHTFSTGGGGYAPGQVCRNNSKAKGITGSPFPAGDPFDVDFVAHEMGHQFNATHTFNGNTGNCSGAGENIANGEPGSGSTIMGYAGICNANDLQANSDPYFHPISFDQITAYITTGLGNGCSVPSATGNTPPVVNAGSDYTIPKSTPFILTGSATDANGDALTYSWDEVDYGGPFGNPTTPSGQAPLFRSFVPVSSPVRTFPKLSNLLNNSTTIGEVLPSYGRTVNFRLTARDNRVGGGGVCSDEMRITVNAASGPFLVTAPNTATSWDVASFKTITWNVAGSNVAPVNCANVSIQLSTDGGQTFPITILASTPNDGSEEIKVPANVTTQARIRIMAVGNIFFDISNANFTIKNATTSEFVFNDPPTTTKCDGVNPTVTLKTSGLAGYSTPIELTAAGNPAGSTVAFSSNTVTPGNDVTVTLQGTLAAGQYIIAVNGASGSINKSVNLVFLIGAPSAVPTLNTPANNTIGQSTLPTFNWSAVNGASAYNLEVSTTSNFASNVQAATNITATSYTLTTPLAENSQYYWRVTPVNTCGSGTPSTGALFRTSQQSCAPAVNSTNVPKTISASGEPTVTSNLVISQNVTITDINVVGLKGTHDYISDIGITLTSPNNTTITLFDQICDDELNFDLNLDDESATTSFPCPPIGGVTVRPTEALSAFDGQSSLGTWKLTVQDYYDSDGGSLTGWGLRICSNVATPLPVNWLSFTGQKGDNNTVALQWSTANEVNNHHYEIERSVDGVNFSSTGNMASGNNPSMLQQYYFTDLKPYAGASYYRLKQIDKDGHFTYSAIVKITLESNSLLWTVYPNPAHTQSTIRVLSNMNKVNIALVDASGKMVYRYYLPSVRAGEQISLPVNNLAKGIYLLKVETATGAKSDKIIVQ